MTNEERAIIKQVVSDTQKQRMVESYQRNQICLFCHESFEDKIITTAKGKMFCDHKCAKRYGDRERRRDVYSMAGAPRKEDY